MRPVLTARRRLRLLAVGAYLAGSLAGCGIQGLSFVRDDRLTIVAPDDRAEVRLPVTVRWTVEDFDVTGPTGGAAKDDAGYFAIFVDRSPQPPGRALEWLARDDPQCQATPGCPDEAYFASRDAYSTEHTQFTVDRLPDLTDGERRDFHQVTIVLLDGQGKRIGESAFRVEFRVDQEDG